MSKFYGKVIGQSKTEATRRGSPNSGIVTYAASWAGAIRVELSCDSEGNECFCVSQVPWCGNGESKPIASGKFPISENNNQQKGQQ